MRSPEEEEFCLQTALGPDCKVSTNSHIGQFFKTSYSGLLLVFTSMVASILECKFVGLFAVVTITRGLHDL